MSIATSRRRASEPATDLRHRVIDASRALLEEVGVAGFSMREVARRAGVTHQAPYHHFPDRGAILAEVVVAGFGELTQRLATPQDAGGDASAVVRATGEGYVGFAIDNPGLFKAMFRPELWDASHQLAVRDAGEHAHAQLQRLVGRVHGARAADPALVNLYWSVVHGLAALVVEGPLAQVLPDASARRAHAHAVLDSFSAAVLGLEATRDPGGSLLGASVDHER